MIEKSEANQLASQSQDFYKMLLKISLTLAETAEEKARRRKKLEAELDKQKQLEKPRTEPKDKKLADRDKQVNDKEPELLDPLSVEDYLDDGIIDSPPEDEYLNPTYEDEIDRENSEIDLNKSEDYSRNTNSNMDFDPASIEIASSIKKGNDLIYAETANGEVIVNNFTPKNILELSEFAALPVGSKVTPSLEVKRNREVIFSSNPLGVIEVNNVLKQSDLNSIQDTQKEIKKENTSPEISATQVLEESTKELESNTSKQYLEALVAQIKTQVREDVKTEIRDKVQGQVDTLNRSVIELSKQNRVLSQELWRQRQQNKRNPSWWSQITNSLGDLKDNVVSKLTSFRQESQAAVAVKMLMQKQIKPGENAYFANDYTISRQGSYYTLGDKNNKILLKFKATAAGAKILKNNLNENQYEDLTILREQLKTNDSNLGKFARYGSQEINRNKRISSLVNKITEYAQKVGSPVKVAGNHYQWTATPSGDIQINATGKTQPILVKSSGKFLNHMTAKDLAFFEDKFAEIQNNLPQISTPTPASVSSQKQEHPKETVKSTNNYSSKPSRKKSSDIEL